MGKTLKGILKAVTIGALAGTVAGVSLVELILKENSLKVANALWSYSAPKIEMQSDALQLNQNDFIYYVTNKNEEQGIKDIEKIINNSNYEEAWLYLPKKQTWYEIGKGSYINEKEAGVKHYQRDIKKILEKNKDVKELIFYHNHPSFLNDSLTKGSHVSMDDIRALIYNSLYFPDYKIKEKICSKEGITEYFLTEEAIKEFKLKDSINLKDYYNYEKDSSITFDLEYFRINFKPHENIK